MLSSSQIPRFFGHQYLWKQYINIFDFLHGNIHQEKVVCEATTFGWVWPGMPIHTQTCLDSPGVPLGGLGGISR